MIVSQLTLTNYLSKAKFPRPLGYKTSAFRNNLFSERISSYKFLKLFDKKLPALFDLFIRQKNKICSKNFLVWKITDFENFKEIWKFEYYSMQNYCFTNPSLIFNYFLCLWSYLIKSIFVELYIRRAPKTFFLIISDFNFSRLKLLFSKRWDPRFSQKSIWPLKINFPKQIPPGLNIIRDISIVVQIMKSLCTVFIFFHFTP